MDEFASKLRDDLKHKWDGLMETVNCPESFLINYFESIKNEVDLETEKNIIKYEYINEADKALRNVFRLNSGRTEVIQELEKNEKILLDRLVDVLQDESMTVMREKCALIGVQIDEAFGKADSSDVEDLYERFAVKLYKARCNLESFLLSNQTFFWVQSCFSWSDPDSRKLICLMDDYLSLEEIRYLK